MRRIYLKDSVAPGTQRRLAIFSSHSFQLMLAIIFVSARDNSSPAFLLLLLFYCHQSIPDSLEAGSSYLSLVGMCETDFYESSRVLIRHHTITVRVRTSKCCEHCLLRRSDLAGVVQVFKLLEVDPAPPAAKQPRIPLLHRHASRRDWQGRGRYHHHELLLLLLFPSRAATLVFLYPQCTLVCGRLCHRCRPLDLLRVLLGRRLRRGQLQKRLRLRSRWRSAPCL
mmetsp:Transcript_39468/g.64242  ORF Transcript_39468/g.64242 Transcript_39468/m.64242 type:complete len:225 (-) Transcript_39468:1732-2406(-)